MPGFFTRSANAGAGFENCILVEGNPYWGTMEVGSAGELYIAGAAFGRWHHACKIVRCTNTCIRINWDFATYVDMDGYVTGGDPINPVGILGQVSLGVDRSDGPGHGNVYVLASVQRISVE